MRHLKHRKKGFFRLMAAIKLIDSLPVSDITEVDIDKYSTLFHSAMNDDFNSPILIGHLFDLVKTINSISDGRVKANKATIDKMKVLVNDFVFDVLGLKPIDEGGNQEILNGLMDLVIDLRNRARLSKDWDTSDAIRDQLNELNIIVKDRKDGATWDIK